MAHPWQESAKFGLAYFTGYLIANLLDGQPLFSRLVGIGLGFAIVTVLMGLSLRGGSLRRRYQRRLDRLHLLMTAPPSGWYPDPSDRHEFRFWTGQRWTDFALDNGVQCADPLPEP